MAQQVDPGFIVEVYAAIPDLDPASLSFDPTTGDLYVGRDIQQGPLSDHAPIWRVAVDRSVTPLGCAIDDPDGVLFDASGILSGTPGAVLVASFTYATGTGVILATTAPCPNDGPTVVYPASASYYNPYDMVIDGMGRFLMTNVPDSPPGEVWVDEAPPSGILSLLVSGTARVCSIAVDAQDRIFLAGTDGTIAIHSADGTFDRFLATGMVFGGSGNHAIALGPGLVPWGTDAFTVDASTGNLLRIDPTSGARSPIGSCFTGYYPDAAFGPDGALYLADFWQDRILRVRARMPLACSSFDVDSDGWVVEDFVETCFGCGSFGDPPVSVGTYSPTYSSTGGNPGGFVAMSDPTGNWFWFSAPSSFLGDKSAAFGGRISLDMRVHPDPGMIGPIFPMVMLVGAGNTLFANTEAPGPDFGCGRFEIPLAPCAWRVGNYATGPSPSATALQAVLGDLEALHVSGDWVSGTETADLDNVCLYGPTTPTVCAVSPDHGPNTGIAGIVITGTGFLAASTVLFGTESVSFTVDSDTQINADLGPTNTLGFVDVSVTTPEGTGTLTNGFDYFVPPSVVGAPCGAPYLTWAGSPTLGETLTLTTQNLGSHDQFLLIDWSNIPNPKFALYLFNCRVLARPDQIVSLGNSPSHSISIPQDVALLGVHLRIQSIVRARPSVTTQALDAVIGE